MAERLIAGVFTVEYFVRWRVIGKGYCLSAMGLIDFIVILPFLLGFFVPVEWLEIIRTLRVMRLLKWYRYSLSVRIL